TLNANGFPAQGDFGNAFIKFSTVNNKLAVADYFALFNTASESSADTDLGSGGAMLLPDLADASGVVRHLALGAGKDGNIYAVDRDNMGKFNPSSNNIYQQLTSAIGAEFGAPAFFNNTVFFGGVSDRLKAFSVSNAKLSANPSSQTGNTFPYPGTTPAISANGNTNGIVWAAENGSTAVLHAYDASNLATELYNSNQAANGRDHFGTGNKFIVPTVANGKVYVGTTTGVGVFGLLHSSAAQLSMKSAASFAPGVALAPDMIAFGQGAGIAASATVASENPWPVSLAGVRLEITDSQGQTRPAPIYFVMTDAIAFQIPAGSAPGPATATLTTPAGGTLTGTMNLERVSPGLFTANASGSGVAAGFWIKAAASGEQAQGYLFDPSQ